METATRVVPRQNGLRWASLVLAALGLIDSGYLAWIKLAGRTASCSGIGDCTSVNNSRYAVIGGVPIALLGAGAYLALLAFLAAEGFRPGWGETLRLGVFGLSLVGVLYSAYLSYIEVAVLKAICPYCVVSAIILVSLLVLSVLRLGGTDAAT